MVVAGSQAVNTISELFVGLKEACTADAFDGVGTCFSFDPSAAAT
jgi:hypothetical protein